MSVWLYEDTLGHLYLVAGGLTANVSDYTEGVGLVEMIFASEVGMADWLNLVENPVDVSGLKLVATHDGQTIHLHLDQMGKAAKGYFGIF